MKTNRWVSLALACIIFFFLNAEGVAVPLQGTLELFYHEFQGEMPSIELNLNGALINTGPITFSLDLTDPISQVDKFDFDKMVEEYSADLFVTFPLLNFLNEPSQRIHVEGMRSINIDPVDLIPGEVQIVNIYGGPFNDKGVFGPGQLFEGWVYSNHLVPIMPVPLPVEPDDDGRIACAGSVILQGSGQVIGALTSPDGTQIIPFDFVGTGKQVLRCRPVPEPSTIVLVGCGLIGLARLRRGRTKAFRIAWFYGFSIDDLLWRRKGDVAV